ncbi:MAG TPA: tyrosine-type recombinase/integrase, partial [Clostridia bacterium]|nr:tyrosine-type recombinase/integrase [Clostridia bacterium]
IIDNPIKNLDRPATKRTLPKYLTLDESTELLEIADLKNSARDYCMLTLFLNCGMRLSELVAINRTDVRDDNTLKLLGKGNKERIVYLNEACLDAINTYLEDSKKLKRKDDALFTGQNGHRLSPRRVEQIIGECLKNAGLSDKGYTPHKLRHTAATLMYRYGNVDVRILKEILGHSNLATTEIYTHVSSQQLEHAADSSPLAQKKRAKKAKDDGHSSTE